MKNDETSAWRDKVLFRVPYLVTVRNVIVQGKVPAAVDFV
jgi:hypothetical protein